MLSWKTRSAARLEICHEYSPLITFLGTLLILGSAWAIDAHKSKTKQRWTYSRSSRAPIRGVRRLANPEEQCIDADPCAEIWLERPSCVLV
jgi:hypothetical protein